MMRFAARLAVLLFASTSFAAPETSPIEPPAGAADMAVRWMQVRVPDLGVMVLAIARPAGEGPFPTVIILHGTHGLAREYVQLARALANEGVLGVAACWFSGGRGAGLRFVTPVHCSEAPAMSLAASPTAQKTVSALVEAVRGLPDVERNSLALFGHSVGGGTVLNYALDTGGIRAAVIESAGYTDEQAARIARLEVPILILHGAGDTSADGGSPFQTPQKARSFEAALRAAGKPVEAVYYENAGHNTIFTDPKQFDDAVRRIVSFIVQSPETR
jgi:carboxymethylenebutenolidase